MAIDLFAGTSDEPAHPRLRGWKKRINDGETAELELYGNKPAIGLTQPKIYVEFFRDGNLDVADEADWDPELNEGLIALHVRAIDQDNEAERFALGLRDGFQSIEREFGNGYFNSVLLDLIQESDLDSSVPISEILKYTYHDQTDRTSRSYDRCREALALGIGARARELKKQLAYSEDDARTIMTAALAKYLDERFSVSSRKQLGLL